MNLHAVDPGIIVLYFAAVLLVGILFGLLTTRTIYLVLRQWSWAAGIAALLVVTSVIIKLNWYDKLEQAGVP